MPHIRNTIIKRALLLMAAFSIFFLVFAGRVLFIQSGKEVNGQDLQTMAESRWTTTQTLRGERGDILDRKGETLAQEIQSYTAFAILDKEYEDHVIDPEKTAQTLAPYIDLEVGRLEELLSKEERFQVELGSGSKYLTLSQKEKIESLGLPGIHFRTEPKRFYPKQTFASHVLGYTERDMSEARMGLEASLNEQLSPTNGSLTYQRNRKGIPLLDKNEIFQEPKNGRNVFLTIDSNIQTALEQAMTDVEEEYQPNKMTAIVANAETGEILGMSNRPSFNPNQYETITNYTNYAVSDRIEPGSTMKIFTLSAAIDAGVYNGNDTYQSGTYQIGGRSIGDHNNSEGWGEITYDEGLERSSNVAFAKLTLEKLKPNRLYDYLQAFGFWEPTGIDLPNEADSNMAELTELNAAVTSYGQSSAVTPIQMVQAATAIANDGEMMSPYIINKIYDPNTDEFTYESSPESAGTPISKDTAEQVREKLEKVVIGEHGTGHPYYIDGIDVSGKTGTAQIPNPEGGGYISGQNKNIFSFLGMAPVDDPKIIVYVIVDRPQLEGNESGSAPVSQIFNPVMKQSLSYMNLSRDNDVEEEAVFEEDGLEADSYINKDIKRASEDLKEKGLKPIFIGDGSQVQAQYPAEGEPLIAGEKVFLLTDGERRMPDMSGWSLREVKRVSELLDVKLHYFGSGYVTDQSIKPGALVQMEDYVTVEFKSPSQTRGEDDQETETDEQKKMDNEEQEVMETRE